MEAVGNIKKSARKLARRLEFQGLGISIETDKGQERHWKDPHNGTEGVTVMRWPYGYVKRSPGDDGDLTDCFIGPNENATKVYVIDQLSAPEYKVHDEYKVMLGFNSADEAKAAYLVHYNSPKFFGSMETMTMEEFKNDFVNKSVAKALPGMIDKPIFTKDVDLLPNVEHWVNQIGNLKDKDLQELQIEIWGPGYQNIPVSTDSMRAEIRGFLIDQQEYLAQLPPQVTQEVGATQPVEATSGYMMNTKNKV